MILYRLVVPLTPVLLATACVVATHPVTLPPPTQTHEVVNNYVLGDKKEAFVGQVVIATKDFHRTRKLLPVVTPAKSFSFVVGDGMKCDVDSGHALPITSEATHNGSTHLVAELPSCGVSLLVAQNGTLADRLLGAGGIAIGFRPPAVLLMRGELEDIDVKAGYTNFELLYGGTDGRSFSLSYREYTSDNMARPAFAQPLTFENAAKSIRFRNLRITIHEATSEHLLYTVTSDTEK